jgi:uncharacterized membrane protein YqjE
VQLATVRRKDDAGSRSLRAVLKSGVTTANGATASADTGFLMLPMGAFWPQIRRYQSIAKMVLGLVMIIAIMTKIQNARKATGATLNHIKLDLLEKGRGILGLFLLRTHLESV